MTDKDNFPCNEFQTDLNASFQACGACGWPKPDHKPMIRKRIKRDFEKGRKAAVVKKEYDGQKDPEPCDRFERNLQAVGYEVCHCKS